MEKRKYTTKIKYIKITKAHADRIISGEMTLTELVEALKKEAESQGKSSYKRTALKERILKAIENDEKRKKILLETLKKNSKTGGNDNIEEKGKSPAYKKDEGIEKRKEDIFDRILKTKSKQGRSKWTKEGLERKYNKFKNYMIKNRNEGLTELDRKAYGIEEEQVLVMLEDYPKILTNSINNKMDAILKVLDNSEGMSKELTNSVVMSYSNILCSALDRVQMNIKILEDNNLVRKLIKEKSKDFILSPESMYALIEYAKAEKVDFQEPLSRIFLTSEKLKIENTSLGKLQRRYSLQDSIYKDNPYVKRKMLEAKKRKDISGGRENCE